MEKKKLKLSISGASKKTINSIEQARSQPKNTVVIEELSQQTINLKVILYQKKQISLSLHLLLHLILKKEN